MKLLHVKNETEYLKLIRHLDIKPHEFAMIGNSLKSDILPVLNIGAIAIHIPYHTTWELEKIEKNINHPNFIELTTISDVINYF